VTFNDFDFQHSALKGVFLSQFLAFLNLAHPAEVEDEVGETLASDGRRRYETKSVLRRVVLPVESHVETLFVEGKYSLLKLGLEMVLGVDVLSVEGVARVHAGLLNPLVESVDFVEGNAEGSILLLEQGERFECLLLQAVHDVDHQHRQVTKGGTTRTQVGERLVTGGVNDEEAGQFQVKWFSALHHVNVILQVHLWEVSGTDLLSDTTRLVCLHISLSQTVKNQCFSSIDVTHDTNDGTSEVLCFLRRLSTLLSGFEKGHLALSSSSSV